MKKIIFIGLINLIGLIGPIGLIAHAQPAQPPVNGDTPLIVSIPVPGQALVTKISNLGQYIQTIYRFSLGAGGLFAMLFIVYGGILYTTSAGNPSKQGEAKDIITNAIWGLVLLFGAFLILNTINPRLVGLKISPPAAPAAPSSSTGQQSQSLTQAALQQQAINAAQQASVAAATDFDQVAGQRNQMAAQLGLSGTDNPDPTKWSGWDQLSQQEQSEMAELNAQYFAASSNSIGADLELAQAARRQHQGLSASQIDLIHQYALDNNCGNTSIQLQNACVAERNLIYWDNLCSLSVVNANIAQNTANQF